MDPTIANVEVDLPGQSPAAVTAEVRLQVSGIIQERRFAKGSLVRAGQPLSRIDPSLDQRITGASASQSGQRASHCWRA